MKQKRVLMALSGGVDSSVAAGLLKEKGYDLVAVNLHLWDQKSTSSHAKSHKGCCSLEDVSDARSVAMHLEIPFYILNFEKEFENRVVNYFSEQYRLGYTPNPCVACNTFLKFDHLFQQADELGCDYVATGHYARILAKDGGPRLLRALDETKDQSYFLYSLSESQLRRILFPLGNFRKTEVRQEGERLGLVTAQKRESMDICFVGDRKYHEFLEEKNPAFRDLSGQIRCFQTDCFLAYHKGIHRFTVGQRWGRLGGERSYVVSLNQAKQIVYLGLEKDLKKKRFLIRNLHHVGPLKPYDSFQVKVRYRQRLQEASIFEDLRTIELREGIKAIAPGQTAVFYQGDEVLGGGQIESVLD